MSDKPGHPSDDESRRASLARKTVPNFVAIDLAKIYTT
jgi:hypothetical protein